MTNAPQVDGALAATTGKDVAVSVPATEDTRRQLRRARRNIARLLKDDAWTTLPAVYLASIMLRLDQLDDLVEIGFTRQWRDDRGS